ncbi:MAG: metal dependent phosphohydrolase [Lacrimispora sp.]|jgi:HD superfamily phosphodiesterase|nr:metal dependent phosphohydrolase [Lacrimispora sp.]
MNTINSVIAKMMDYYKGDPKRIQHFIKVYQFGKLIGEEEGLDVKNQRILETACVVHDIGIKVSEEKYNSSTGNYQEIEGPPIARSLLMSFDYTQEEIDRICWLIGHHHTYRNIEGVDYQILVEADFLVNAWEDGLSREAALNVKKNIFTTAAGTRMFETMYL